MSLVLPEVTNKLSVDANRASTSAHDVSGERPCPIGTDSGLVGHGLMGAEDANKDIFVSHTLHSESESEGHRERKSFWDSDDQ
jgi:hypothetical protein